NQKEWEDIIKTFDFNGAAKMLVKNTVFKSLTGQTLVLTLSSDFVNLLTPKTEESIRIALHKQHPLVELIFEPGETNGDSLSQKESLEKERKQKETESQFLSDDGLKELQEVFSSKVDIKSIKSIKESDNV
ncbi:MAG: DNA polymerase III subunit gamma/tau C-terminal domain-containing protein, partial [Candidatus Pseudothioglobus sp.]